MTVWIVIGLRNEKVTYIKVFSNKTAADELINYFEKYDREKNDSSWDYILQEQTVWDRM